MSTRPGFHAHLGSWRTGIAALGLATLLASTACSSSREPTAEAATATQPALTTAAPEPSATPTSITSADTTTTTSVTTPTTTEPIIAEAAPATTLVAELPAEPIDPPTDSNAEEPIIEVGSIAIPKLGVDMTMYEGIRLTTLDRGPGHWPGSAMPGQNGNVVVGGHRTSAHQVFRHVDQLVPGDEILFRDDAGIHTYVVDRVEIVEPTAVWIVDPTDTPTATLFACHPPGSTAQRIVVFADLVGTATA